MALEQTLISTGKLFFSSLIKPLTNPRIPSLSLPFEQSCFSCRLSSKSRVKCSVDYNEHHYTKPAEIPWRKELTNAVHLIGVVGTAIEIKHLPSGKVVAWTRLAVRKSPTDTSWINLTFWDELAHVAYHHVEKGNQIHVSGRLVTDVVENDEGKQQTYYKVVAQQLNFVEKSSPSMTSYDRESNFVTAGKKFGNNAGNNMGSTEELWQAFFANPVDWWDNRNNKKNPKYPDFKHKDTGEALWVEGRNNPPWVKSQLAILDSRMGAYQSNDARMDVNFMSVNDAMPF